MSNCAVFKRLWIALCVVSGQFFGYLYPLSRVGVNSIHLNANAWSVCRYDNLEYCELILRSKLARPFCCVMGMRIQASWRDHNITTHGDRSGAQPTN